MNTKGIMHRDIKPENLIFKQQNSNELVFVDFGLSDFETNKNLLFTRFFIIYFTFINKKDVAHLGM